MRAKPAKKKIDPKDEIAKLFSHHRALIYTLSLAGGLILLLTFRDLGIVWYTYWIFSGIIYGFLITEVLSTYKYANKKADYIDLPHIPDNTLRPNFYYHTILPSLLYFSLVIYMFFDFAVLIDFILIVLICPTYYAFLRHIRATYENDYKTESWSHAVLDAANIIVYFTIAATLAELAVRYAWSSMAVVTAISLTLAGFLILTLWKRLEVSAQAVFGALVLMILMGLIAYASWVVLESTFEPIRIGGLWALSYYLLSAVFIHKLEGSLKFGTIVEYALIAAVAIFLLAI